jgi:outer membrane protein OmpA-like peptidoglycan-associated protein
MRGGAHARVDANARFALGARVALRAPAEGGAGCGDFNRGGRMRRAVTPAVMAMVAAMALAGCATRSWVNDVVRKKDAELGRVSSAMVRLDDHLTGIEGRVVESNERAQWAQRRADEAYARADDANSRLTRVWAARHERDLVETIHVHFAFDRADLSDAAQTALLAVANELKHTPRLSVDLEGFTDTTGERDYNIALSQRRVEAVRRFLVQHGADLSRVHSVGLGPLYGSQDDAARQRRVTVKLMVSSE